MGSPAPSLGAGLPQLLDQRDERLRRGASGCVAERGHGGFERTGRGMDGRVAEDAGRAAQPMRELEQDFDALGLGRLCREHALERLLDRADAVRELFEELPAKPAQLVGTLGNRDGDGVIDQNPTNTVMIAVTPSIT